MSWSYSLSSSVQWETYIRQTLSVSRVFRLSSTRFIFLAVNNTFLTTNPSVYVTWLKNPNTKASFYIIRQVNASWEWVFCWMYNQCAHSTYFGQVRSKITSWVLVLQLFPSWVVIWSSMVVILASLCKFKTLLEHTLSSLWYILYFQSKHDFREQIKALILNCTYHDDIWSWWNGLIDHLWWYWTDSRACYCSRIICKCRNPGWSEH